MIPHTRLDSVDSGTPTELLYPDSLFDCDNLTEDYEYGSLALQDPTGGLQQAVWQLVTDGSVITLQRLPDGPIETVGAAEVTIATEDGNLLATEDGKVLVLEGGSASITGQITEVSLAFDDQMYPYLAWAEDDVVKLQWHDQVLVLDDAYSPRLTLDDKRPGQELLRDVLFFYLRNLPGEDLGDGVPPALCYRQQREQFSVERVLARISPIATGLGAVGMNTENRLQIDLCGCESVDTNAFIFTLAIPSDGFECEIYWNVYGQDTNVTVDWGDGNLETITDNQNSFVHTYASAGTYDVSMSGQCAAPYFGGNTEIVNIKQWGYLDGATDWKGSFDGCVNLECSAIDSFGLNVTDTSFMFFDCRKFNGNLSNWDVSKVVDFSYMFYECQVFNSNLDSWNVSNATDMSWMFWNCSAFNSPLNNWNVSKVTTFNATFYACVSFNQPLDKWNIAQATDLRGMFSACSTFNQNINSWNTGNVTTMEGMFADCAAFNQPLDAWDTSNVIVMRVMFAGGTSFNQPIGSWDVSSVKIMEGMFYRASSFNQPLNSWVTTGLLTISGMFKGALAFNQPLYNWDVTKITPTGFPTLYGMQYAFDGAVTFDQDLSCWGVQQIPSLPGNFATNCPINGTAKMPKWAQPPNTGCT